MVDGTKIHAHAMRAALVASDKYLTSRAITSVIRWDGLSLHNRYAGLVVLDASIMDEAGDCLLQWAPEAGIA